MQGGGVAKSQPIGTAVHCTINFGDLTPDLTYSRWELSGPSIITLRLGYASDVAQPYQLHV
jgi:hypothetical protein